MTMSMDEVLKYLLLNLNRKLDAGCNCQLPFTKESNDARMNTFKHTFKLRFLLEVQQTLIPDYKLFHKKGQIM